jgi:multidrug efflux system outer membrane protein
MYEPANAKGSLDLAWWNQFDDPVLTGLIEEALRNNQNLKVAAANIKAALGLMIETRAPLFPQAGYEGDYQRNRFSNSSLSSSLPLPFSFTNPMTTWEAMLTGSWQLDLWGRTRRLTEAAEANVMSFAQARRGVLLSLVASVADNYILLRGLDEQLAISIRTMQSYHEEVVYFETQFKYGQTSQMSVAQAKTQYEQAAAQIPQIEIQIAETENILSVLLGSNPRTIPRGKSIYDLAMPEIPEGLPSELLCQRPDIMQAEENLIAANAEIGAAKALYFPSVSLTGFFGNSSTELSSLFTGPSRTWNFTGSVVGPIFTAGSIYGQVMQAKANREAAVHTYQEVIQNAFADVENSLIAHTKLMEQIESETRLVEAAGEYQHLAMLQYKGGYSPYYVVIQAQEQYFPAQLAWAQTRAQIFSSIVNIYQALGGGWINIAEELTATTPDHCD